MWSGKKKHVNTSTYNGQAFIKYLLTDGVQIIADSEGKIIAGRGEDSLFYETPPPSIIHIHGSIDDKMPPPGREPQFSKEPRVGDFLITSSRLGRTYTWSTIKEINQEFYFPKPHPPL